MTIVKRQKKMVLKSVIFRLVFSLYCASLLTHGYYVKLHDALMHRISKDMLMGHNIKCVGLFKKNYLGNLVCILKYSNCIVSNSEYLFIFLNLHVF